MNADKFIIYSDMDGSILSDWDKGPVVPEYNLRMLEEFRADGGLFSVASGRLHRDIMSFFPEGMINAPVVCANGSQIYDTCSGSVIYKCLLPEKFRREAASYCRGREDVSIITADENELYHVELEGGGDDGDGYIRNSISEEEFYSGDYTKICYVLRDLSIMDELKNATAGFDSAPLIDCVDSSPVYLEVMKKGISKAGGISRAMKYAGAEDRILVCLGDFYNDAEMLRDADISACPDTSPADIKEMCRFVCCSNNEGAVGDLIKRLREL